MSCKCREQYSLSVQDVEDFESQFGPIAQGSSVMVKTGWSKFWHTPSKRQFRIRESMKSIMKKVYKR
ncbi:cyclase family protein [Orientia tsutsugamushi]|uniref:cyclase family protein n=1 Tax=Orientia tsutsugamushi TaxID=784 RepID=UPI003528906F